MALSERERHELYLFIEGLFGRHTEAFLNTLAPDLPERMDRLRSELRGEMAELRGELADLRGELTAEMAELRVELKTEMADLRVELTAEMADLRVELETEITDLRGEVRGILPRLIWANVVSAIGVAGLVLAAVSIA